MLIKALYIYIYIYTYQNGRIAWLGMGRPDVQVETVLAQVSVGVPHVDAVEFGDDRVDELKTTVGQLGGVEHALPVVDGHGPLEASLAHRLLSERYAQPRVHPKLLLAGARRATATAAAVQRQVIVHVDCLAAHQTILCVDD